MSCDIEAVSADGTLCRVARAPDAWAWPSWAHAGEDGTFGHRYDDPEGRYRVVYASSQRLGAFMEALAPFRPDPAVVAGLAGIEGEDEAGLGPGRVPARWASGRVIGEARTAASFAAVGHSRSLGYLRQELAGRLLHHGIDELDGATIRLRAPRALTQEISRLVYGCSAAGGAAQFGGVHYRSRLGDDLDNWALFERAESPGSGRAPVSEGASAPIARDDRDLVAALERLGIELV